MLRQERWEETANGVAAAMDGRQAEIWTAVPGIIQSFNAAHNTVEVQPAIQAKQRMPDGTVMDVTLPMCVDVPVQFPSGGGYTITFPVKKGDECLLVFASRCIDGWWDRGGVQKQEVLRMHDLSDGHALLGTRSKANALKSPSTDSTQLRTEDGKTFVEVKGKDVNVTTDGNVTVTSAGTVVINATGNVTVMTKGAAKVSATGSVTVDGASVVLNGGARQVARLGDQVICPAGVGHITQGAPKVFA